MKKSLLFFLLLSNFFLLKAQQNVPFVVSQKSINTNLDKYVFAAKNLNINRIEDLIFQKNQFKKIEESIANFGINLDENWVYFDLQNLRKDDLKLVLYLDQTFLEKADFYQFSGDSLVSRIELNYKILQENRPFAHPNFVFPFELKENQKNSIFLRIKTSPIKGISRALIQLSDLDTFNKLLSKRFFIFGILVGFLMLTFLIGLILFCFSRKKIYLIYGIYILSVLAFYLSNNGYLNTFFADSFLGSPRFEGAILMLNTVLHLYFIEQFIQFENQLSKKFRFLILSFIAVAFVLSLFYLFVPIPYFFLYFVRFLLLFVGLFIIFLSIWSLFRLQKTTFLYCLATFPSIVLVVYFLLVAVKILPLFSLAFSLAFPFTVFEIIIFGIGLVYQFNQEKVEIELKLSEERRTIAQKIITGQEEERQRIAQDLHDDLGSTLSTLKNKLSESNDNLDNQLMDEMYIADKAVTDLREILQNLTPVLFLQKGLKVAVQELVFLNNKDNLIRLLITGHEHKLDWEVELSIFRIAKELLNNALKHAKASKIEIQFIYFEELLYLSVEDNGIGYELNNTELKGIGLKNISLRVNYLNGKIIQNSSNKGTSISIDIPYDANYQYENSFD